MKTLSLVADNGGNIYVNPHAIAYVRQQGASTLIGLQGSTPILVMDKLGDVLKALEDVTNS